MIAFLVCLMDYAYDVAMCAVDPITDAQFIRANSLFVAFCRDDQGVRGAFA